MVRKYARQQRRIVMLRMLGYGFIVWVVPYVSAIPLLGVMKTDLIFFKTLMILIGGLTGAVCVILYFSKINKDYLNEGIRLGLVWLVLNWLLDFAALLPVMNLSILQYFKEIGLRYLVMPAMTIPAGYLLDKKSKG